MNLNDLIALSTKNYTVAQVLVAEMIRRATEEDGSPDLFIREFKADPQMYLQEYSEFPEDVIDEMWDLLLSLHS